MIEQDKKAFKDMMGAVMSIYNKQTPDQNTLRIWFMKLERFEFQQVADAFNKWIDENKFPPTPSDILGIVKAKPIEFTALPKPTMSKEDSKILADNVVKFIAEQPKPDNKLNDMRAWARKIINNPKDYPALSLKFAKEALRAN